MLRVVDDKGCVIIGLNRAEIRALVCGERICSPAIPEHGIPHYCFLAEEDNAALAERMGREMPAGLLPGAWVATRGPLRDSQGRAVE
jgi:hypothetical protein